MTFLEAIKTCFKKYCVFSGRARRSEYWFFFLFTELLGLGLNVISQIMSGMLTVVQGAAAEAGAAGAELPLAVMILVLSGIMMVVSLAILLPSIAVRVRRLHDVGRSGKWILIPMICNFVGILAFIIAIVVSFAMVEFDIDELVDSEEALIVLGIGAVCMIIPLLISAVFSIIIFVWTIKDSQPGINKWGPNPKGIGNPAAGYAAGPSASSSDFSDKTEELRKYKQLLDEGVITEEEFEQKKKELLNL